MAGKIRRLKNFLRDEDLREIARRPGVYILVGTDEENRPAVYVGQSEHVSHRLDAHNKSVLANKIPRRMHQWHTAFVCNTFNHFMHDNRFAVEKHLYHRAKASNKYQVRNKQFGPLMTSPYRADECSLVVAQFERLLSFFGFSF